MFSRRGVQRAWIRHRACFSGHRRIGKLPGLHQDRGRMVSQARRPWPPGFSILARISAMWTRRSRALPANRLFTAGNRRLHRHGRRSVFLDDLLADHVPPPPENHPIVSAAELTIFRPIPPEPSKRVPGPRLWRLVRNLGLPDRKFHDRSHLVVLHFWLPKSLNAHYGLNDHRAQAPLGAIYTMTTIGSIGGGWISSAFLKRGWTVNRAQEDRHADLRAERASHRVCRQREPTSG